MSKRIGDLKRIDLTMFRASNDVHGTDDNVTLLGRKLERAESLNERLTKTTEELTLLLKRALDDNCVLKRNNELLKKGIKIAVDVAKDAKGELGELRTSVAEMTDECWQASVDGFSAVTTEYTDRIRAIEEGQLIPQFRCPVCFNTAVAPSICAGSHGVSHRVCRDCFVTWTDNHRSCPVCRKALRRDQINSLFGETYMNLSETLKDDWRAAFRRLWD
jgi:hypothetical protein